MKAEVKNFNFALQNIFLTILKYSYLKYSLFHHFKGQRSF